MFLESVGPNSKCVDFEIRTNWVINNRTFLPIRGGACYEVRVCINVRVYVCACVRMCVRACMCAYVCACVCPLQLFLVQTSEPYIRT